MHNMGAWLLAAAHHGGALVQRGLRAAAAHTGLPVLLLAALLLVVGWRVARKSKRLFAEFALAGGLVVLALRMGWIRW